MNTTINHNNELQKNVQRMHPLSLLIGMIWAKDILLGYFRAVLMRIPLLNHNDGHTVITILFVAATLYALPYIAKKIKMRHILFVLSVAMVYFATYALFPENAIYLDKNKTTFFTTVLPMFFIGVAWDAEKNKDMLYRISFISIIAAMLYRLFISGGYAGSDALYRGDMGVAYYLLPHLCMIVYYAFENRSVKDIVVSIVGVLFLILNGNRGSILCLSVFIVLMILLILNGNRKFFIAIGAWFSIYLLSLNNSFMNMLLWLEKVAGKYGMSVRVIEKVFDGELFDDTGRSAIQNKMMSSLSGNEAWGYGLFGDRVILKDSGAYAHNLVIELWVHFGFVIGTLLLCALVVAIIKKYLGSKMRFEKVFLILLFCSYFIQLMFSRSYLIIGEFFLLIGFCFHKETAVSNNDVVNNSKD